MAIFTQVTYMNKLFVLFCVLFFYSIHSFSAPSNYSITGKVVDSLSRKGVPFVTITVQNSEKKVLSRLATDANGAFAVDLKLAGKGELLISAVGYSQKKVQYHLTETKGKLNLGEIDLTESSATISQVVVTAQKPLVKIEPDKLSYNPEADPETASLTALDMMRKVPLLTVDGDDNVKLKGASNYKVLVNGKESPLMNNNAKDVLKSMPASSIKKIEVITSPSSKYSAEGVGGIINIITTKQGISGVSGNVSLRADNRGGYGGNIYTSAGIGKLAFSINYGNNKWKSPKSSNESDNYNYLSNDYYHTSISNSSSNTHTGNFFNGELSYEVDSLNLISASFGGFLGNAKSDNNYSSTVFTNTQAIKEQFLNKSNSKSDFGSFNSNIDYQRSFKKVDKMFTASYKFDYTPNNNRYNNEIIGITSYPSSSNISKNNSASYENTVQIDFVNPITPKHQYEVGLKYIYRTSPSDVNYFTLNGATGNYDRNDPRCSNLDYKQNVIAAYVGYLYKIKQFTLKTGARVEGAYTDASFKQVKDTSFTNNLTDVVPYINLSYNLSDMSSLKFSFTQRLQRPGIWYLNPYVNDENPKYISYGNPSLKTEKVNSFDLGYNKFAAKFNVDISLYARLNDNPIQPLIFTKPTGEQVSTYANNGRSYEYGTNIYGSIRPIPVLNISINSSISYSDLKGTDATGKDIKNTGWSTWSGGNLQLTFLKNYTFSGYGGYGSGWIDLQSKTSSFSYCGFSLRRSFLDKKLNFSVSANNPFTKNRTNTNTVVTSTSSSVSRSVYPFRSFSFSVSYRFGSMGQSVKKAARGISNDDVKSGGSKSSGGNGSN